MSGQERNGTDSPRRRPLKSWEKIAEYLGKDPKTARRWEMEEDLPIYRDGRSVFAFADELDEWRKRRIFSPPSHPPARLPTAPPIVDGPSKPEGPLESPRVERPVVVAQHRAIVWTTLLSALILLAFFASGSGRLKPIPAAPVWDRLLAKTTSENATPIRISLRQRPRWLTITPDGTHLFAANESSTLVSVIVPARGQIGQIDVRSDVRAMTVSPDGRRLYVGTSAAGVAIVDVVSRRVIAQVPTAGEIFDQAITPDGRKLFLAMSHKGLWKMQTASHELTQMTDQECAEGVTIGPDQKLFVSYQCSGAIGRPGHDTVEIFNSESEERLAALSGPPLVAGDVAPSPDGQILAIDGGDACNAPQYDHAGCEIVPSSVVHILRLSDRQFIKSIPFPAWTNLTRFVDRDHLLLAGDRLSVVATSHYVETERLEIGKLGISGVAIDSAHSKIYLAHMGTKEVLTLDSESAACSPLDRNLVAFYSGDGVFNDLTGGPPLNPVGAVGFAPGRIGQAFLFSEAAGYLAGPATMRDPFGYRDSSFVGYAKFASKQGEQTILDRFSPQTRISTHLWKSNEGRIIFDIATPAAEAHLKSHFVVVPERWYHFAITKSDEEVVLYVDGAPEAKADLLGEMDFSGPGQEPFFLGATHEGKESLKGKLDEVLFYNRALTSAEIQTLFQSRVSGPCRI